MTLEQWLSQQDRSVQQIAADLLVTRQAIYRYVDGSRMPSPAVMRRIVAITAGRVTPNDFYDIVTSDDAVREEAA